MTKKRADGEGTLFWDEGRQRWRGRLAADEAGKRPWFSGRTQAEALEARKTLEKKRDQGLDLTSKAPTVEQFGMAWLKVVERHRRGTTADGYSQMLRLYINPHLGKVRVDKLTARRVQQWVDDLVDAGFSPHTVRNAYQRLRGMLRLAVRDGLIAANPARDVELPPLTREGVSSLTIEQAVRVLRAADGRLDARKPSKYHAKTTPPHRLSPLLHCYIELGLRKGEGLGLKWSDIDFKAGTVTIRRQVQSVRGQVVISEYTKTDAGRRTLPVSRSLLDRLRAHRASQADERKVAGAWHEHGLVFPSERGTPISPSNAWKMVQRLATRAGLDGMRVHDLRRTCATLLGQRGVQEIVIGAILGHSAGSVTGKYMDVSIDQMREAIEGLSDALARAA